jgi:hypothetical protein
MSASNHTITVLAHEPERGWLIYATVPNMKVGEQAETDALAEGFDETTILKQCRKCGACKSLTKEYFRRTQAGTGWRGACRECERAACREYGKTRNHAAYLKQWKAKYPEKVEEYRRRAREQARQYRRKVLLVYGEGVLACACCGENFEEFLTLDHINGGGTEHRKILKGVNFYMDLRRNGYPDRHLYRVLCSNCNSALARADNTFEGLRNAIRRHRNGEGELEAA